MTRSELETCIEKYGRDIYSFCRRLTGCLQEADDLYQDTFLKAVELSHKIKYDENPKSYLISITLRLWKNKKRKSAIRNRIAAMHALADDPADGIRDPDALTPEDMFLKQEEAGLVIQAVNRLPERLKLPILLFYMEELPIAQISGILKIPAGTVKSRLHQARKTLEKELEVVLDEKHR